MCAGGEVEVDVREVNGHGGFVGILHLQSVAAEGSQDFARLGIPS